MLTAKPLMSFSQVQSLLRWRAQTALSRQYRLLVSGMSRDGRTESVWCHGWKRAVHYL